MSKAEEYLSSGTWHATEQAVFTRSQMAEILQMYADIENSNLIKEIEGLKKR